MVKRDLILFFVKPIIRIFAGTVFLSLFITPFLWSFASDHHGGNIPDEVKFHVILVGLMFAFPFAFYGWLKMAGKKDAGTRR